MASWKGLYSNVDMTDLGIKKPRAHEQRSQPGTKGYPKEESVYEPFDPAVSLEKKQTVQMTATWCPAWKPSCTRRMVLVAGTALLAASMFLNVLLFALGIVHCKWSTGSLAADGILDSKIAATLEQVRAENRKLQETVPSSFLLYNEDRKVCVTRKQPNSLTESSCDPDVQVQHFQLLSRGLLHHVDSQRCVAATVALSTARLLLQPCNAQSPLQRWECRDNDLLALEGKDLYFNSGNNVKSLVMLYNRNGPWSRWLIHGTRKNICSTCPPFAMDWTFFQGSYYYFSRSLGTWDVANQTCAFMGSHLVMINSAEEKGHVTTIMKVSSCWIGLTDQEHDGAWKWVDGTHVGPGNSYWHQNEPNGGNAENCALMKSSQWYDYPCKESYHWICEREL
ncbi:macrophage mannose receptor 1-like isoform X2 [Rhineura floridana]|uniref:macrophage mannose receptor 1-like isoform X2 n=1 Tax=Rhineura floridana TaxID=261503 RepID=UPI002AC85BD0|nr:macrophage mannose receptor 1-like isoform X2 [Rhineura floridana]